MGLINHCEIPYFMFSLVLVILLERAGKINSVSTLEIRHTSNFKHKELEEILEYLVIERLDLPNLEL